MVSLILLTVYSMPRFFPHLTPDDQIMLEEGRSLGPHGLYIEPDSVQGFGEAHIREDPIRSILAYRREQDLLHMKPYCRLSPTPSSHSSDIILEGMQTQFGATNIALGPLVSDGRAELLAQYSRPVWQAEDIPFPNRPFRCQGDDMGRSSSPETKAAQCHSSTSASPTTPLLV
jgi:hypothetical protein